MFGTRRSSLQCLAFALTFHIAVIAGEFFKPFNVTYNHRALIIDGKRRMLNSAGIHYPRANPESKEGGADVIQTHTFWNGHEPVRGQYNFEGRYDLVKFVKLVGSSGLYLHLQIGPYVCAEWNFGSHLLSYSNYTIENEYGNMESSYGQKGKDYVKWAAKMATGLGAGVPWVMCKQVDAPGDVIDACNEYYCDGYKSNSYKKPTLWMENWDGWYTEWGGTLPHRPAEDLAFAVAWFFEHGGSFQNY